LKYLYLKFIFESHNKKNSFMANVTLFSQIISKLDRGIFKKLVNEKQTDKYPKDELIEFENEKYPKRLRRAVIWNKVINFLAHNN